MRRSFTRVARAVVVIGTGIVVEGCGPSGVSERWEPVSPVGARFDAHGGEVALAADGGDEAGPALLEGDGGAPELDLGDSTTTPARPDGAPAPVDIATEAVPEVARDLPREAVDAAREVAPMEVADAARADVAPVPRGCPSGGACKRIFVTSRGLPDGAFGSLAGADTHCQRLAEAAGLGGGWWAWLSDSSGWPAGRFGRSAQHYLLVDGTRVAAGWDALTSGTLAHAIDVFETGQAVPAGRIVEVWTGTSSAGQATGMDCANWTNTTGGNGGVGLTTHSDRGWTQAYTQLCNRGDLHLYCFEQ